MGARSAKRTAHFSASLWSSVQALATPTILFWIVALVLLGAICFVFQTKLFLDQPNRDLWQHLAALRALLAAPWNPENPFIPGTDGSRHFHPYWVGISLVARLLGWTEWEALGLGGFISGMAIASGIYLFGSSYYRSPWGPLALLITMLFGWLLPISHTGLHSPEALIEGIGYPAALLIGLSLSLWGLTICALTRPILVFSIAPLSTIMFATHQLGASIGFLGVAALLISWPEGSLKDRLYVGFAVAIGLSLSSLWPYFNPFRAMLNTGNLSWSGPPNFYSPMFVGCAIFPAIIGLIGIEPWEERRSRFLLFSLTIYTLIYLTGLTGLKISGRFLMPMVLTLHIGLASVLLSILENPNKTKRLIAIVAVIGTVEMHSIILGMRYSEMIAAESKYGSVYSAGIALTSGLDNDRPVAAYDIAAWPLVAAGQKVYSIPWPEPGIRGLRGRQIRNELLFRGDLSREERLRVARAIGVHSLVLDLRYANERRPDSSLIRTLMAQSVRVVRSGPMIRFDLE